MNDENHNISKKDTENSPIISLLDESLDESFTTDEIVEYSSSPKLGIVSKYSKNDILIKNFTPLCLQACFISNTITFQSVENINSNNKSNNDINNGADLKRSSKKMQIEQILTKKSFKKKFPSQLQKVDNKNSQSTETLKNFFPTKSFNEKLHDAIKESEGKNKKGKDYLTPKNKQRKSNISNKRKSYLECKTPINNRIFFINKEQKTNIKELKTSKVNHSSEIKTPVNFTKSKNLKGKTNIKKRKQSFTTFANLSHETNEKKKEKKKKDKKKMINYLFTRKSSEKYTNDHPKSKEKSKPTQIKKVTKKYSTNVKHPKNNTIHIEDFNKNEVQYFTNREEEREESEYIVNCLSMLKNLNIKEQPRCKLSVDLNLPKLGNKKVALFDLDETLVHCVGQIPPGNPKKLKYDKMTNVLLPTKKEVTIGINIRPDWEKAMDYIKNKYHIIIYTASHQSYADAVLNVLDPHNKYFPYRLYRNNCVQCDVDGTKFYVKDLDSLKKYYDLKNVLLIDNSVLSFAYHLKNGIPIIPFFDSKTDKQLMIVAFYLMSIADVEDLSEENNKRIDVLSFLKSVEDDESSSSEYDSPKKNNNQFETVVEESPQKEKSVKVSNDLKRRTSVASLDEVNNVSNKEKSCCNYDNLKKPLKKFTSLHSNVELAKKKFNDLYNKISNI